MASAPAADELALPRALTADADHRDAERVLRSAGWTFCGAGDWSIALRSPSERFAARISPFDPATPFNAELYRRAASTGHVPGLFAHVDLDGGASLLVLELLHLVPQDEAAAFHRALADGAPELGALAEQVHAVHEHARRALPWCGPIDANPANVMRNRAGRLVLIDPFYADGHVLYGTVLTDPARVAAAFPQDQRRHMFDLPLDHTGPAEPEVLVQMRTAMANADQERARRP